MQRDAVNRIGLAAQGSERGARIGKGIDANAEPRDTVTAGDSHETENQNNRQSDRNRLHGSEPAEVHHDHDGDKNPQNQEELSLREEISFAGFVNQFGDVAHGLVNGQVFQARINSQPKAQSKDADDDAEEQKLMAVDSEKRDLGKVGELKAGFATGFVGQSRAGPEQSENGDGSKLCEFTAQGPGICKPGKHSRSSVDHSFKGRPQDISSVLQTLPAHFFA